jgi:hypothetical protein
VDKPGRGEHLPELPRPRRVAEGGNEPSRSFARSEPALSKNERRAAAGDRDASLLNDASALEVLAPVVADHRDREVLAARLWAGLPVVEVAPD